VSVPTPNCCDAPGPGRVLVCLCRHAQLLDADALGRVLDGLRGAGAAFDVVDDLCGLGGRRSAELKPIAASPPVRIVACFPRAVRWLFHAAGAPLPEECVEILNLREPREADVDAFCHALPSAPAEAGIEGRIEPVDDEWVPWFPVIDYSLCSSCRKCMGFCLFGVFTVADDGRVIVEEPDNCKLNCPACARVCPDLAIIFPKYVGTTGKATAPAPPGGAQGDRADRSGREGSPISGADVTAEDLQREPARVDVAGLAKQDVYVALRRRLGQASGEAAQAASDPKQRLAELQEQLDIPDDVIQSLMGQKSKEPPRE